MKRLDSVLAPAKLNLFLHIVGRRSDGYHLLQSVFVLIDWFDTLHFEQRADGQIRRHDATTALPPDDLIVRAARALQQATGCTQGADITIEKSIPAQGGMGGGSSDAASTLLALNRLWGLDCTRAQLSAIGLKLGADVPFFLQGHNAWVEGIGEHITPLGGAAAVPPTPCLVIKPGAGLETARIFSSPALNRNTMPATIDDFAASAKWSFGHNDLQPVAEQLCADVPLALDWLRQRGLSGRMTGSGSAVFAPVLTGDGVAAVTTAPVGWQVRRCKSLEHHPLLDWVPRDV